MKIITVLDSYPPDLNGGAYFTHRLASSLQNNGHQVLVICPSRSRHQHYTQYEEVPLYGVRSWPIPFYKNFRVCWPFFIKRGILKAINDFKPDVIHIQGKFILGGICYRAGKKSGIPMLATNHFMPENFFHYTRLPKRFEPWFNRICWRIVLDMLSNVDAVTTPTETAAKLLKNLHLKKEVHTISCGVDLQKFRPNQECDTLRQRFSIPSKPTVLYTGRLDKEKNLPLLIRAFNLARQQVDAHLVLTGRGTERTTLEGLAEHLGIREHITFTDYLPDAEYPKIHGLATCFVNACPVELQSIVALEAIASGLPLIGINAMALPELIRHGVNGYIFSPNDVYALAQYLIEVLKDPEKSKQMGLESRKIAEQHDIKRTVARYENLYKEISKQ